MEKQEQIRLPESELEVMLALWRNTVPVRTSELLRQLSWTHSWTLSTLKVLLGRLEEKGFVEVTREGRFTLYQALVKEEDYRRHETRGLLKRYYQNSVKSMVAALVSEGDLTGEDLAELEQIIQNAGRG